jgi:hypothetical protein
MMGKEQAVLVSHTSTAWLLLLTGSAQAEDQEQRKNMHGRVVRPAAPFGAACWPRVTVVALPPAQFIVQQPGRDIAP